MVASSLLPVAFHKGNIYFLFGKENRMEDSAKGFSDFGGRVEGKETLMLTALREGSEEMCGFLGGPDQLKRRIQRGGGTFKLSHNDYHIHIFQMEYDPNLPLYFTNNHQFLWKRMDAKMLNDSKLFEKQEIKWFTPEEMQSNRSLFRNFYREITDLLLENKENIAAFYRSSGSRSKKTTQKYRQPKMKGG